MIATTTQYIDSVALLDWIIASAIGAVVVVWLIAFAIEVVREWNTPASKRGGLA